MAKVVLENLSKNYGDVVAVDNVNLEIEDGRFVVLHGPSGCGKTTILNVVAGLLDPTEGAILIDVRMESEHKAGSIKGSVNIPLFMLRLKAESLDSSKRYICYCETGRRSQAAAYLMSEAGFESYTLKGGLQALSQSQTG